MIGFSFYTIDYIPQGKPQPLFYATHFASGAIKAPEKPRKKVSRLQSMKNYQLLSVFHSPTEDIVTVSKGSKTYVLAKGEKVDGFVFVGAGVNYAVFEKNGKEYRLLLKDMKSQELQDFVLERKKEENVKESAENNTSDIVIIDDTHRLVEKETIERYARDLKTIYKNIGLSEVRHNGTIEGFKVTFIRKGSLFAKLGLRRGDILLAVNGQPLNSYKAAFDIYKNIGDITDMTITIQRGNTTMELEYEIN
jgi:general secretion pathway protein C